MKSINSYNNYITFLNDWILSRPRKGYGVKVKMSEYIGVLPNHLSKILKGEVHLTLDQAAELISFLELAQVEGHYFFGLVELSRANTDAQKKLIQDRLTELNRKLKIPESKLGRDREFSQEELETYFSSYLYVAIFIITCIPKYQTLSSISSYFNISKERALDILNFLISVGKVKKERDKFVNTQGGLSGHVIPGNLSKLINLNWNSRIAASFDYDEDINYHRNVPFAVNREDIPKIENAISEFTVELYEKYLSRKDLDSLCCLCLNLFELK